MMPNGIPENSEVVNFEVEDEPRWVRVKLEDGSVIQVKMEIVGILKAGNQPDTGLPVYILQAQNIIRLNQVPKELIKRGIPEKNKGSDGALYR
ncbi:MAG: hypothetical protein ACYCUZ_01730 [Cuniculiplasma sp.]|jgi:hypothetical protein